MARDQTKQREYHKAWRARPENVEKIRAWNKRGRERDPEKVRERNKKWYAAHAEELRQKRKAYYAKRKQDVYWTCLEDRHAVHRDELAALFAAQDGRCAICREELSLSVAEVGKKTMRACLDHDHSTGQIRGWLCTDCNRGLGGFRDERSALLRALEYLDMIQRHGTESSLKELITELKGGTADTASAT